MADQVATYVCVYCNRPFGRVNVCLRHLRQAHPGSPLTYATRLQPASGGVQGGSRTTEPGLSGTADDDAEDEAPTGGADDAVRWAATYAASLGSSSISARVTQFYEVFNDVPRSIPLFASSGAQPTRFTSPFLRQVLYNSTLSTRTGHPTQACRELWRLLVTTPGGGEAPPRSAAAVVKAAFNSATAFSDAVNHERERLVNLAGWRETTLASPSGSYVLGYRSGLQLILADLKKCPMKHLFSSNESGAPSELVGPSRGAIFDQYEAEVRQSHGGRAFVLPLTFYSDGTTLPNSGAAMAHPLRMACEIRRPDTARKFISVGALPQVFAQVGVGSADRARNARRELFQRSLFVAIRDVIRSSHDGVDVDFGGELGVWRAYPRVVCYSADYPEKRAALCLRGVGCAHPCCTCMAEMSVSWSAAALDAGHRDVVGTVTDMLVAHALSASDVRGSSGERDRLCYAHSCNALPPALAAMAGLGTPPYMLFRVFGLDTLHVGF